MMTEFINGMEMLGESARASICDHRNNDKMSQFFAVRGKPVNVNNREIESIKHIATTTLVGTGNHISDLIANLVIPGIVSRLPDDTKWKQTSFSIRGKENMLDLNILDKIYKLIQNDRAHHSTFEIIRTAINPNPKKELNRSPCINPLHEMIGSFMGARHAAKTQMYINNLSK